MIRISSVFLFLFAACGGDVSRFEESRMLDQITTLSSDEFGGRAPGSPGEELTVDFLTREFREAGAEPGNPDGTWVQEVPLVGYTVTSMAGGSDPGGAFVPGTDFVVWTRQAVESAEPAGDLLFVGYGVEAPEYDWDDFGDADLTGKILVILVNDPPGDHHFGGVAMTYYGRWTYKFEKAAEMGALGALIVHETGPAGYPWEVVRGSWTGEQFGLDVPEAADLLELEGWISRETAVRLFEAAGHDFEAARAAAAESGFSPMELGIRASFDLALTRRRLDSRNVVARIPGAVAPEETVIYSAHWDHLGTAPDGEGDRIYNGAIDNATGTTGLLALARAFAAGPAPRRSILFLAVTAEEQGLLGSLFYAANPLYPTRNTVAALNLDGMNVWGPTRDITVIGLGQSELDRIAEEVAATQGRTIEPDPEPQNGYYYRSDHFAFAQVGVPAFYGDGGANYIGQPEGYGREIRERWLAELYHKPADEVEPGWTLSGMVEDLEFLYQMGRRLADSEDWPEWSATSEFRATREADRLE